ncbi:class I SAM-dependent methyltransferase [Sulfurovum sp.]|uniref:class I SAM-dependent methyltransferase n=1 Tax=Sulfurovum sp. TaxID=1969726 RepID=UPI003563F952
MKNQPDNRSDIYRISLNAEQKNDVRIMAFDYIDKGYSVLDVGCACGDLGELLHKNKECKMFGMEYDAGSIAIASGTHAYQSIHQIDLNDFNEKDYTQYFNYFDVITLLDVLEHLANPENVVSSLKKLLKKDAFLIISIPNIAFCDIKVGLLQDDFTYTDTGILDRTHIKFYTYKSISSMLTSLGLEVQECKPKVAYFSTNTLKVPGSIKRYIKKDPHSFVYQYIVKALPSDKAPSQLKQVNDVKMDIQWSAISGELGKLKRRNLISKIFPKDSFQHKMAKKLKSFFNNG